MRPQPLHDEPVLKLLLGAGMVSAKVVAAADLDGEGNDEALHFYNEALHRVALLVSDLYGTSTVVRRLCSESAVMLQAYSDGVQVGEIRFYPHDDVWTFEVKPETDPEIAQNLFRTSQLVVVYANVLVDVSEDWVNGDSPHQFEPSSGTLSDTDSWNGLLQAIPEDDLIGVLKSLLTVTGILGANVRNARRSVPRKGL